MLDDFEFLHNTFEGDDLGPTSKQDPPDIYLVEDDQVFGKTLRKFLEKQLHLTVTYFASPSECLLHVDEKYGAIPTDTRAPFILVSDISFDDGGADGLLLVDLLKEKGHKFESIVMLECFLTEGVLRTVWHVVTWP